MRFVFRDFVHFYFFLVFVGQCEVFVLILYTSFFLVFVGQCERSFPVLFLCDRLSRGELE